VAVVIEDVRVWSFDVVTGSTFTFLLVLALLAFSAIASCSASSRTIEGCFASAPDALLERGLSCECLSLSEAVMAELGESVAEDAVGDAGAVEIGVNVPSAALTNSPSKPLRAFFFVFF